jgi:Protein of unknown function (DUF3592)
MTRAITEHYKELLMALACALFALSGVGELAHNLRLALTGVHTPGVIVANKWDGCGPSGHSCAYFPVVRFRLRDGHSAEVEGTIGSDNPPQFHVGQKVTVAYDPQRPTSMVITAWGNVLAPLGLIVLASFFALAMAWPLLRRLRRRTPMQTRKSPIRPRRNAPTRRHRHAPARRH